MNIPAVLGVVISRRLATLHDLETVYSLEDAYLMAEIVQIDNHNQRQALKKGT